MTVSPGDAWTKGTNIRTAMRINKEHEQAVRLWVLTEVGRLCKMVDANKTLSSDEEMRMTCRAIVDDFPLSNLRSCGRALI